MGTDIYSDSAMVLSNPQILLTRLNSENLSEITHTIAEKILAEIRRHEEAGEENKWHRDKAEEIKNLYRDTWLNTSRPLTVERMKFELMELLVVEGTPSKYENNIHLPRLEEADLAWGVLISTLYPEFPSFLGFDVWGSARYSGYEVPLGIPCAKFSEKECFKRVSTPKGRAFKKFTGIGQPTGWTEISY